MTIYQVVARLSSGKEIHTFDCLQYALNFMRDLYCDELDDVRIFDLTLKEVTVNG